MQYHIPVMLNESCDLFKDIFNINNIIVDLTFGFGGHSIEFLKSSNYKIRIVGIDRDNEALEIFKKNNDYLLKYITIINSSFDKFDRELLSRYSINKVNGIFFDLGVSSYQIDNLDRGFSYSNECILDMRMDTKQQLDAYQIINTYSESDLSDIIYYYGDDRYARRIAKHIVKERKIYNIKSSSHLVKLIRYATRQYNFDSVKRTFQALRIAVNNELNMLKSAIVNSLNCLDINGIIIFLSYHSQEDRIIKHMLNNYKGYIATYPLIKPTYDEIKCNKRASSAKLRAFKLIKPID